MPRKPTWAQIKKQRDKSLFIGRQEPRQAFRRNFACELPEYLLFALHGQAGIGKSFLVARYQDIARERESETQSSRILSTYH